MPFNFYDTHHLLAAVQQLTLPTTFLRDRYFPSGDGDLFSTTDVLVEYRDGSKRAAPFVAPRKGGVTILRSGYEVKRFEPPFIAPRRMLTIDDLQKRGFGEALLSNMTPAQRQQAILLRDVQELSQMITRREEAMAAEVMQTGGCVMKHIADDVDDGDAKFIQFYTGDSNPGEYTPSGSWGKDYAGITGDIAAMARMLTKRGLSATELVVGSDAADAILANTDIQKLLDIKNYNVGRIDPATLPNGAAHIATLNCNGRLIDVICYDEEYTEGSETKAYINPKTVILTAPAAGRTLYGAVTQVEQSDGQFHTYTGRRVPKYLSNAEGNTRTLTLTSCPILIPNNKTPFIVASVLD